MHWKPKDKFNWHRWFAWFPVVTVDGEAVWLEVVETRLRCVGPFDEAWECRRIVK